MQQTFQPVDLRQIVPEQLLADFSAPLDARIGFKKQLCCPRSRTTRLNGDQDERLLRIKIVDRLECRRSFHPAGQIGEDQVAGFLNGIAISGRLYIILMDRALM